MRYHGSMPKATVPTEAIPITALAQHEARDAAASFIRRRLKVKLHRPSKRLSRPALVAWPASPKAVTAEFAEAMAQELLSAAKAARALNIPRLAYMDPNNPDGYYGR